MEQQNITVIVDLTSLFARSEAAISRIDAERDKSKKVEEETVKWTNLATEVALKTIESFFKKYSSFKDAYIAKRILPKHPKYGLQDPEIHLHMTLPNGNPFTRIFRLACIRNEATASSILQGDIDSIRIKNFNGYSSYDKLSNMIIETVSYLKNSNII